VNELRGTGPLVRLIVARDRIRLLAWVAGLVLLVIFTAVSTKSLYPTQHDLDVIAAVSRDNPAALAFNGPDQALDTMGGQIVFQTGAFTLALVGLMAVLLVGRATRGEEDSGRLELVRSMPVGRHAPLAAGLLVVVLAMVVLGLLTTLSMLAVDLPTAGGLVFGASFTAVGLAFVGVTAVAAQVAENPRVAAGTAGAVLGASYVIRAVGDAGSGTLSWLSPIGWAQKARPYAGEAWWPLGLCAAVGISLVWLAVALVERRDFGAGMVAPKAGRPTAAPSLSSPLGLAVRLHRGAVLWWALGVVVLAATYGSLTSAIDEFVADNQAMVDIIASLGGADLTDAFLATSLLVTALLATGPALQVLARLHAEESGLRAEPILATRTSRARWMASHVVVGLGGAALTMAAGGIALGLAYALVGGGAEQVPRLALAALAYVPATWVLAGLAIAIFGVLPRWTAGAWVALTGCFVIGMFGALLDLPSWVMDLSPFQHTPALPATGLRVVPLVALTLVSAVLVAIGFAAFRARDLLSS
jgi:ABC-2 type transport system permease protein